MLLKKIKTALSCTFLLSTMVSFSTFAAQGYGVLQPMLKTPKPPYVDCAKPKPDEQTSYCFNYDFFYPSGFTKNLPSAQNGWTPLKMQARFTWHPAEQLVGDVHAIVAYGQGIRPGFTNYAGQPLLSHGAGAFVGVTGLNLELWFNAGNAHVWNASDKRCGHQVLGGNNLNICLDSRYSVNGSYIEPLPANWRFTPNSNYWVRITIGKDPYSAQRSGFLNLNAELFQEDFGSAKLIQRAQIQFPTSGYLPLSNQANGAVGRAFGSYPVTWYAFDYF